MNLLKIPFFDFYVHTLTSCLFVFLNVWFSMLSTMRLCIQSASLHGQTVLSRELQAALTSTSLQDSAMMAICTLFRAKPSISLFRRTGTWPTCSETDHACKQLLTATIVTADLFPLQIMRTKCQVSCTGDLSCFASFWEVGFFFTFPWKSLLSEKLSFNEASFFVT